MSNSKAFKVLIVIQILMLFTSFWGIREAFSADKNYVLTRTLIEAQLMPNGEMEVTEWRTYNFIGVFSYAYREMPISGKVKFSGFQVLENGIPYELSNSEKPGSYQLTRKDESMEIKWYYSARNESRTFEFRYKALNAVQGYQDAAVLYYKFISEEWSKPNHNVEISIKPPSSVEREQINEW
ncbi:DUF2207 domain-containing protein [bacterium]|nr:DUF2207 domain-containing protein [bacterium]